MADRSEAGRDALLTMLSSMLFDGRQPTAQEVSLFADIAHKLLPHTGEEARSVVSARLGSKAGLPKGLVLALASDVLLVASPILAGNPDLTDDDLADLAFRLDDGHRIAIAGRENLSFRVTDVLVSRGNVLVLRAVAENTSSEISDASAHKLVDRAADDEELCRILALRNDLPEGDAERLVMLVAKRLRGRMARPAPIEAAPATPPPVAIAFPEATRPVEIGKLIQEVAAKERTLDSAVLALAAADRYNDLATLLTAITHIDELSILKVLVRSDANGIVNVLRALDIEEATWAQVVKLRQRRLRFSDTQARFEREDFAKLAPAKAKQTLAQFAHRRQAS
ncbi:DUF2336 domain-containing protein [Prosthecomicrobium sp. N25]|uniref:DUF2336 domain-containing protein n=1 Tax=Prosthecomicrobium sp. N25 TaxID=3129254 RepID=UPI00307835C8